MYVRLAVMTMIEDAKTEEYTAGGSCGAYIEMPCKFAACRALYRLKRALLPFISVIEPRFGYRPYRC